MQMWIQISRILCPIKSSKTKCKNKHFSCNNLCQETAHQGQRHYLWNRRHTQCYNFCITQIFWDFHTGAPHSHSPLKSPQKMCSKWSAKQPVSDPSKHLEQGNRRPNRALLFTIFYLYSLCRSCLAVTYRSCQKHQIEKACGIVKSNTYALTK